MQYYSRKTLLSDTSWCCPDTTRLSSRAQSRRPSTSQGESCTRFTVAIRSWTIVPFSRRAFSLSSRKAQIDGSQSSTKDNGGKAQAQRKQFVLVPMSYGESGRECCSCELATQWTSMKELLETNGRRRRIMTGLVHAKSA